MVQKKTLKERRAESDARIVASAIRNFGLYGYTNASIVEIAKGAGVTSGLITQRFGTKENLFYSACEEAFKGAFSKVNEDASPREALTSIVDDIRRMSEKTPEVFDFWVMVHHASDFPREAMAPLNGKLKDTGSYRILTEAQQHGMIPQGNLDSLMASFAGNVLNRIRMCKKYSIKYPDYDEFFESIAFVDTDVKRRKRWLHYLQISIENSYDIAMYINIMENRGEILRYSEGYSEYGDPDNVRETTDRIIETDIHVSERQQMHNFLNLDTLGERIQGNRRISKEYIDVNGQIHVITIIPLTRNDAGQLVDILIGIHAPKTQEAREQTSGAFSSQTSDKRTVLVIDDNELNREILAEILKDKYSILKAQNGAEGLRMLHEHMREVSVVILDMEMPVMTGYEFLESVQKDPFLSKIPVVVATGNDSLESESRCLRMGAIDFVTKPYIPEIIRNRIASIIRLRESSATMTMLQTDEKTGLYTLQAFNYYATMAMQRNPKKGHMLTVLDVDHLKRINDQYGEETGNRVLKQVADTLNDSMEETDICGRYGTARFLMFTGEMYDEQLDAWIKGLFDSLHNACNIKGISFKAGIYREIDTALPISTICDRAIMALRSVKQDFENRYALYDEAHAEVEHRLAALETDMRDAYEKREYEVYYQPKHEATTGKLVGAEALIRWNHPTYGFLAPGEFIPLFERNGFIVYADYYVLKRTCKNLKQWTEAGLTPVPISVNASKRDFEKDNYMDIIKHLLQKYEADASLIHLEVTESLFSDNLEEICRVLQNCRDMGLRIELDDFGAGYSSLTALAELPLDVMKLDISFMRNFNDARKQKVLTSCIGLAKSLGMKVVAEGVETEDQLQLMRQYGCDWIQGYYYSKPLPEAEFREYLKAHKA